MAIRERRASPAKTLAVVPERPDPDRDFILHLHDLDDAGMLGSAPGEAFKAPLLGMRTLDPWMDRHGLFEGQRYREAFQRRALAFVQYWHEQAKKAKSIKEVNS